MNGKTQCERCVRYCSVPCIHEGKSTSSFIRSYTFPVKACKKAAEWEQCDIFHSVYKWRYWHTEWASDTYSFLQKSWQLEWSRQCFPCSNVIFRVFFSIVPRLATNVWNAWPMLLQTWGSADFTHSLSELLFLVAIVIHTTDFKQFSMWLRRVFLPHVLCKCQLHAWIWRGICRPLALLFCSTISNWLLSLCSAQHWGNGNSLIATHLLEGKEIP